MSAVENFLGPSFRLRICDRPPLRVLLVAAPLSIALAHLITYRFDRPLQRLLSRRLLPGRV